MAKTEEPNFSLKWKESKELYSAFDTNFIFCNKNIYLSVSRVSNYRLK